MPKLTDRFIASFRPEGAAKDRLTFNTACRGVGVPATRSGTLWRITLATQGSNPPSDSPVRKRRATSCHPADTNVVRPDDETIGCAIQAAKGKAFGRC